MLRLALLVLLAIPASAQNRTGEVGFTVQNWGGLHTNADSARIPDVDAQDMQNVLTDRFRLEVFPGITRSTELPSGVVSTLGHYGETSNDRYLLIHSTTSVYRTDFGTEMVVIATVNSTSSIDMVPAFGRFYIADGGLSPIIEVTATSSSTLAGSPACSLVEFSKERIWCGNIPLESGSRVRVSSYAGAAFWTLQADGEDVNADAPDAFDFQKDDGDDIQCMKLTPFGMYVGKDNSSHIIKGNTNITWRKEVLSPTVGCADDRSVQMHEGVLMWLAKNGVYGWPGKGPPQLLTEEIDDVALAMRQGQRNLDSWTVDSAAQFSFGVFDAAGPGATTSATLFPGSVVPSSWTGVDTSSMDFAAGTMFRTSTRTTGELTLGVVFENSGFEAYEEETELDENTLNWSVFNSYPGGGSFQWRSRQWTDPTPRCESGWSGLGAYAVICHSAGADTTINIAVLDASNGTTLYMMNSACKQTCQTASFDTSTQTAANFQLRITQLDTYQGRSSSMTSVAFPKVNKIPFITDCPATGGCYAGSGDTVYGMRIDFPEPFYLDTGTYVSAIFDTGLSTPIGGPFTVSSSIPFGTDLDFQIRSATSAYGGWSAWADINNGARIVEQSRFWQYSSSFSTTISSFSPAAANVSLVAATTAYYYSEVAYAGTEVTTWGTFSVADTDGGGQPQSYWVRSSNSIFLAEAAAPAWVAQPANATVTCSTGAYIQWRELFNIDSGSQAARTDRVVWNWSEGSVFPATSASYGRRYFLCGAFSEDSVSNDKCLVYQRNGKWTTLVGPAISSLDTFDGTLYAGDALSGKVWKLMQEGVYNYDGDPIAWHWVTKDFMFAPNGQDWAVGEKVFKEFWLDANFSTGTLVTVGFSTNKSGTYEEGELDLGAWGTSVNKRVPFDSYYGLGKYMRFKISGEQLDHSAVINAYSIYGEAKPKTGD